MTDQFRYDAFTSDVTPHLWRLAHGTPGSVVFDRAYSSTPTCTPARAALLTGKSPWSHGMLGYAQYADCGDYPTTFPRILREWVDYTTVAVGKNHFGPVSHIQRYQHQAIYDGLPEIFDDYDAWFNETMPNMDPLATCGLQWNDWRACPYYYDEYVHPTSWTTRKAIQYMENYFSSTEHQEAEQSSTRTQPSPLLLKVSYHRPHSPYDPPRRI